MRDIGPIITTSIRNSLRSKTMTVVFVGILLMCVVGFALIFCLGSIAPTMEAELPDRSELELYLGMIMYTTCLLGVGVYVGVFNFVPMTREKSRGIIESLLATPLSPKAIWMGKGLAIFLPGFVISVVSTLVVVLAINLAAIIPAAGDFFLPTPVLLTGFLFNPLLFFGLLSFTVLFSLANNPDIAIMPSFLLGFGLMTGIPVGVATGAIDLASWSFALWYLAGAIVIWAVVCYLSRLLTKEQIVLSSKGG